jgi:hypothetical protein
MAPLQKSPEIFSIGGEDQAIHGAAYAERRVLRHGNVIANFTPNLFFQRPFDDFHPFFTAELAENTGRK